MGAPVQKQNISTHNQYHALGEIGEDNREYQLDGSANEDGDNEVGAKSDRGSHTTQIVGKRKYNKRRVPPTDRRTRAAEKQSISNPLN